MAIDPENLAAEGLEAVLEGFDAHDIGGFPVALVAVHIHVDPMLSSL